MMRLDPHREVIVWTHDEEGGGEEIPVTYWDGSWFDAEGNEYAFPEDEQTKQRRAYWDRFYKGKEVKRILVPAYTEEGEPLTYANGQPKMKWAFVPKDSVQVVESAMFTKKIRMNIGIE